MPLGDHRRPAGRRRSCRHPARATHRQSAPSCARRYARSRTWAARRSRTAPAAPPGSRCAAPGRSACGADDALGLGGHRSTFTSSTATADAAWSGAATHVPADGRPGIRTWPSSMPSLFPLRFWKLPHPCGRGLRSFPKEHFVKTSLPFGRAGGAPLLFGASACGGLGDTVNKKSASSPVPELSSGPEGVDRLRELQLRPGRAWTDTFTALIEKFEQAAPEHRRHRPEAAGQQPQPGGRHGVEHPERDWPPATLRTWRSSGSATSTSPSTSSAPSRSTTSSASDAVQSNFGGARTPTPRRAADARRLERQDLRRSVRVLHACPLLQRHAVQAGRPRPGQARRRPGTRWRPPPRPSRRRPARTACTSTAHPVGQGLVLPEHGALQRRPGDLGGPLEADLRPAARRRGSSMTRRAW